MSTARAIAAIEALGSLVKLYLVRTDDLVEMVDVRCGALEDRLRRLDRQPDANGSRRVALLAANQKRRTSKRPRLALAIAEQGEEAALAWQDDLP